MHPMDQFRKSFKDFTPEIQKVLPANSSVEKFERTVMTAIQINPELLQADRRSLFNACLNAASDGLLPDQKEGAITSYKMKDGTIKAQWMPMIYGIIKKIRNSGELASLTAQIVYEKDIFKYWVDENGEHIKHEPDVFSDRGKKIGVYGIIKTKDGEFYYEFMTADEVMAIKQISKAKYGPWSGPFENELWRKSVIRRLSKRAPMSSEVVQLIQREDELTDFSKIEHKPKSKQLEELIDKSKDVDLPDGYEVDPTGDFAKEMNISNEEEKNS